MAGGPEIPVCIDGYSDNMIYEHCILMRNDGLIGRILDTSSLESKSCNVGNLTSEGFDLLDKIRTDTVWNKTKSVIGEKDFLSHRNNKNNIYCNYYSSS